MASEFNLTYVDGGKSYPCRLLCYQHGYHVEVKALDLNLTPERMGTAYLATSDDASANVAEMCGYQVERISQGMEVLIRKRPVGRPKKTEDDRHSSRGVSLSGREWLALETLANHNRVSVSRVIGKMIHEWSNKPIDKGQTVVL